MLKLKQIGMVFLFGIVALGLACDAGQMDEANKLVNEGNTLITKANEMTTKANALTTELLGDKFKDVEDIEKYKADNKAKFDELIKLNEDMGKAREDAAAKFEGVSKLKVDDKFKEYTSAKGQELKKGSEIDKAEVAFLKEFLAATDAEKANQLIADSNKKSADLKKQADDFKNKAEKIAKDNPTLFK